MKGQARFLLWEANVLGFVRVLSVVVRGSVILTPARTDE
jgi:hypothetical protein